MAADVARLLELCERIATRQADVRRATTDATSAAPDQESMTLEDALRGVSETLRGVVDDAPWDSIDELLQTVPTTESDLLLHRAVGLRDAITRLPGPDRASPLVSMSTGDVGSQRLPSRGTPDIDGSRDAPFATLRHALDSFLDTLDRPGRVPLRDVAPEADAWMDGLIDIFVVAAAAELFGLAPGAVIGRLVDGLWETANAWHVARLSWDQPLADGLRALAALFAKEASTECPSPVALVALVSVATGLIEEPQRQEEMYGPLRRMGARYRTPFETPQAREARRRAQQDEDQFAAAMSTLDGRLAALRREATNTPGPLHAALARSTSEALGALADRVRPRGPDRHSGGG